MTLVAGCSDPETLEQPSADGAGQEDAGGDEPQDDGDEPDDDPGADEPEPEPALGPCRVGRIAVSAGGEEIDYEEVAVPAHTLDAQGMLQSDLLFFSPPELFEYGVELPIPDIAPPEDGQCSFEADDPRFVYLHTFVYATRAIEGFNEALVAEGFDPLPRIEVRLGHYPDLPATGFASATTIDLDWGFPELDAGLIAHELGHTVDDHLLSFADQYSEGAADLYAALVTEDPQIYRLHNYDVVPDGVDTFLHADALPTWRQYFESLLAAVRYWEVYAPFAREQIEEELESAGPDYDTPHLYSAAPVVSQPIWQLQDSGLSSTDVLGFVFRARADLDDEPTFSDAAQTFINAACDDPRVDAAALLEAYRERGLAVRSPC